MSMFPYISRLFQNNSTSKIKCMNCLWDPVFLSFWKFACCQRDGLVFRKIELLEDSHECRGNIWRNMLGFTMLLPTVSHRYIGRHWVPIGALYIVRVKRNNFTPTYRILNIRHMSLIHNDISTSERLTYFLQKSFMIIMVQCKIL